MPDVRELLHDAAATPSRGPDVDALWQRGRRRRTAAWSGGALSLALIAVVGVLLVPFGRPTAPIIGEAPTASGRATPLPDGWQEIRIGQASFGVPGDWDVREGGPAPAMPCDRSKVIFTNVSGQGGPACNVFDMNVFMTGGPPGSGGGGIVASVGALSGWPRFEGQYGNLSVSQVNGIEVERDEYGENGSQECGADAEFCPSFGVSITEVVVAELDMALLIHHDDVQGQLIDQIVATIERVEVIATGQGQDMPDGWQQLRQGSITFAVPGDLTVASVSGSRCWQRVADVQLDLDQAPRPECRGGLQLSSTVMVDAGTPSAFAPYEGIAFPQSAEEQIVGGMRAMVSETVIQPSCPAPAEETDTSSCRSSVQRRFEFPDEDVALQITAPEGSTLIDQIVDTLRRVGDGAQAADRACPEVDGANPIADYASASLVWRGATYDEDIGHELKGDDLGAVIGTTGCDLSRIPFDLGYEPVDGDGVFIDDGEPISTLIGVAEEFRLAVGTGSSVRIFTLADRDPVGDGTLAASWGGGLPAVQSVGLVRRGCTPEVCPPEVSAEVADRAVVDRLVALVLGGDRGVRERAPGNIGATTLLLVTLNFEGQQPPLTVSIAAEYGWLTAVGGGLGAVVPAELVDLVTSALDIPSLTVGDDHVCPTTDRAMRAADNLTIGTRQYLARGDVRPLSDAGRPIGLTACRIEGFPEGYVAQSLDAGQLPIGSELVRISGVDQDDAVAVVTDDELIVYAAT